ncbi:hypothetical protein ASG69_09430 [Rhodococcus sp. Leaf225]|nr:hypothetical protein ASG69_09430 [Rhodococcus sp. Leaf225]KQU46351.1 hypothetical protein ASH03_06465 [Rhodococcus sp. Leaf258]
MVIMFLLRRCSDAVSRTGTEGVAKGPGLDRLADNSDRSTSRFGEPEHHDQVTAGNGMITAPGSPSGFIRLSS